VANAEHLRGLAMFETLEREKVGYVVIGGFARVVHGSAEITRGLDIAPSLRESDLRRLGQALDELGASRSGGLTPEALATEERVTLATTAGSLALIPTPWGTRGYDELRIRANRENLGRGLRPRIASTVDPCWGSDVCGAVPLKDRQWTPVVRRNASKVFTIAE
jgi:hypothetical protein